MIGGMIRRFADNWKREARISKAQHELDRQFANVTGHPMPHDRQQAERYLLVRDFDSSATAHTFLRGDHDDAFPPVVESVGDAEDY